MSWRLHLTNQAIQHLDILNGTPSVLAAWSRKDRVAFYDLDSGAALGERTFTDPTVDSRQDDSWQEFVGNLVAPNKAYLPIVQTDDVHIYTTDDGRMRLYYDNASGLFLENDGKEVTLEVKADSFQTIALDRFLGLSALLDDSGQLHMYQQHIRVGAFNLDLKTDGDLRYALAISRGGGAIFATDGTSLVITNTSGQVRKRMETHYFIGEMTCSPDGKYVITSDIDTGVLRIYRGTDLTPLYQRFAIDLLASATQVQLIADLPPWQVALSALTINNEGVIAFAMAGVVCVSGIKSMDNLPRPRRLL